MTKLYQSGIEFTYFQVYVYIPFGVTIYYYISVLDIIILIDRLSTFIPKLKSIYSKVGANTICLIGFIILFIINFPYYFVFRPFRFDLHYLDQNKTVQVLTLFYAYPGEFATSFVGQVLTYLTYSLREAAVIFIVMVLNFVNMIFLKRHLKKRAKMLKRGNTEQQQEKKEDGKNEEKKKKEGNVDRKASIMVGVMCTLTAISNTVFMISVINVYFNEGAAANIFGQMGEFSLFVKYFLNFFVFYFFNSNFKAEFRKLFKLKA